MDILKNTYFKKLVTNRMVTYGWRTCFLLFWNMNRHSGRRIFLFLCWESPCSLVPDTSLDCAASSRFTRPLLDPGSLVCHAAFFGRSYDNRTKPVWRSSQSSTGSSHAPHHKYARPSQMAIAHCVSLTHKHDITEVQYSKIKMLCITT